ncbi:MAG: metallophosphoesterase [Candidatus Hydrogenedentota bacterium]
MSNNLYISRRRFIKNLFKIGVFAGLSVTAVVYPIKIEPFWIKIKKIYLGNIFKIKFVFISDFHYSDVVSEEYLSSVFNLIIKESPEFVLIGGDYITGANSRYINNLTPIMTPLCRKIKTYGILGNHDYEIFTYFKNRHLDDVHIKISKALLNSGMDLLINDNRTLVFNNNKLTIAGVDDLWAGRTDIKKALSNTQNNNFKILLSHNPDIIPSLNSFDDLLVLCGHTHGGQVYIPFIGSPFAPVKHKEYIYGLKQKDNLKIYTTSGVGYLWPGRFLVRPEVTIFYV